MKSQNSVFIIAEAGVNHNGSLTMAKELIDAAVDAKADAVKFQSFFADSLVTPETEMAAYQQKNTQANHSQYTLLKKLELSLEEHQELRNHCEKRSIEFMSTPFDVPNLNMLVKDLHVKRLKISSGDLTNAPLLLAAAKTHKPIILSTGMATLSEIEQALQILTYGYLSGENPKNLKECEIAYFSPTGQALLEKNVSLLQCTTEYPANPKDINLLAMRTLHETFGLPTGFSDHSLGIHIPIAAAALGAKIIEKHMTIDRTLPGPDHKASLTPKDLKKMILHIREVEDSLGTGRKYPAPPEIENRRVARRSLVAATPILAGETFSEKNLIAKRAEGGLNPLHYFELMGQTAKKNYAPNQVIVQ